ncbi:hypothetical protein Aph01nite_36590 [Acrocarpospora phusangensis]|uniref:Uncharacterized protein n=1 Tax=Acrocarpospora phusangensis TaxID=1070424 RepID=A0A919QA45_9ACTN|nr:hypothetical protein [Acrocarpospora phusangensis]GIH25349.1 hypothetical protein Aph01nite_36590 [Acrocarpospora phusangensis]
MSADEGSISFVQYLLPALEDGEYTITATQAVNVNGQSESLRATQSFFVTGIRYQLDDSGVNSVFPPPGSQGEFDNTLPHVVLTDPTLPWQREPGGIATRTGWLALLLFDEQDPPPSPRAMTIADLVSGGDVFVPPRTPELGEQASDPVTVIDVPVGRFAQIAPSPADLTWLAHTRLASPAAKATDGDTPPAAEFAVVFGNRLPTSGHTSTVFLVSLEGYGPYLPSDDGVLPAAVPPAAQTVRLAVLRSWTFFATRLEQSFQGILQALDMNPAALQLPAPPGTPVSQALGMGYTAMNHTLRDGGGTVSWYRGPLLPLGVAPAAAVHAQASDELLRYDPGTGMFDVSYAAAWELGRLLALHDRGYATALFRWKLTVTQQAANQLEEEIVDQLLPPLSTDTDQSLPPAHRRLARVIRDVVGPAAAQLTENGGR